MHREENGGILSDILEAGTARISLFTVCGIEAAGATQIARALPLNANLSLLAFQGLLPAHKCIFSCKKRKRSTDEGEGDHIEDSGAAEIAQALRLNSTLTELRIRGL